MRKTCILLMFLLFVVGMLSAQEEEWTIKIQPMAMKMFGYDEHVGDIFTYNQASDSTHLWYGADYEPLILDMPIGFSIMGEVSYIKNMWGFGLSGWWFRTTGSLDGTVSGNPGSITGIRMWDHTIIPVVDTSAPSGLSPVDYYAENYVQVWTLDFVLIRTLAEKDDNNFRMKFGLKFGHVSNEISKGQNMHAWTNWYTDVDGTHYWDNYISLDEYASVDYSLLVGPVIGFQGNANAGLFNVAGSLNQSVVFGVVDYYGLWTDVDDIYDTVGGESTPYDYLEGTFGFTGQDFVVIPITEAKIEMNFNIGKTFILGFGGFCSIWWNVPVAPSWSIPSDWTWEQGTGWSLNERTLVFTGLFATIGFYF